MRCMSIRFGPGFLAFEHRRRIGQVLLCDETLESCQPMVVIARAIVRLAAIRRGLEFIRERGCPFTPCEVSLCGQPDRECECLCLPGLRKYRAAFVAGQTPQYRQTLRLRNWIRLDQDNHPTNQ